MKKHIFAFLATILVFISVAVPVSAKAPTVNVNDNAVIAVVENIDLDNAVAADEEETEPFNFLSRFGVSLIIGFLIALAVTGGMAAQLKTVYSKSAANDYVKKDSFKVTDSKELFLYKKLEKQERPKNNN